MASREHSGSESADMSTADVPTADMPTADVPTAKQHQNCIILPKTKVKFSIGFETQSGTEADDSEKELLDVLGDVDDNYQADVGLDNAVYQSDKTDASPHKGCFVRKFGEKGHDFGEFQDAKNVTMLPRGRLLITDLVNNKIHVCNLAGKPIMECADDSIQEPWATTVTNNHIAVTSCRNKSVVLLSGKCRVKHSFGAHHFRCPTGITTNNRGQFIICDSAANTVSLHDPDGTFIQYIGRSEIPEQVFSTPRYVCRSVNGDIIISDSGNHKVKIFNSECKYVRSVGGFGKKSNQFKSPYGVCTNQLGDIFVADHYNNRICMFTGDGVFIRNIVTSDHGLVHPQGLDMSVDNQLYVTHGGLKACEIMNFKLDISGSAGVNKATAILHF